MNVLVLKIVCSYGAAIGVGILIFLPVAVSKGVFAEVGYSVAIFKIVGAILRGVFLILCGWAAWKQPHFTYIYAWGAFVAFMVAGAADELIKHGGIEGFGHLMSTYYFVSVAHVVYAFMVWWLSNRVSVGYA